MKRTVFRWGLAASILLALAGCGGGGGGEEVPAAEAPAGPPVAVPGGTSPITLTANTPATTFAALQPKVTVGRVTIKSAPVVDFSITDQDGNAVIGFGSTSKSATATVAQYPNIAFSLAKLVPGANGSPSQWVSYVVTTVPTLNASGATVAAAPTRPTTDNTGTLVDHGNGTYTYTFFRDITTVKDQVAAMTVSGANNKADLGDLTYEPNLVHRLTIQLSGNAPGTGTNTPNAVQTTPGVPMAKPLDVIFDFVPATGQAAADSGREIVATAKCNECHRQLGGLPGDSEANSGAGFHGGSRNETRYCMVCHTEQRKYGRSEAGIDAALKFTTATEKVDGRAVGNMPNNVHKIHMGSHLAKQNYNYAGTRYNEVRFPQDVRNCTKCHDGAATSTAKTAQGDNWKNVPSRLACGACHDGINFATGRGVTLADAAAGLTSTTSHSGFAHGAARGLADDATCRNCHDAQAIDLVHLPVTPPNRNTVFQGGPDTNTNSGWIASNTARLPEGAIKVTYDIKSVSVVAGKPVMVFRMLQNSARADLNVFGSGKTEIWDNFMGSPSVQYVFAVPQDGIAEPTDFNASASGYLRNIWNGTATGTGAGTLAGPDAEGYYTVTLTGVTIPANAKMLTGGLGFSYNVRTAMPLTQTNLAAYPVDPVSTAAGLVAGMPNRAGGLVVVSPNATKVATGFTARRAIVEDARCNACHQELGAFTEEAFHGGQRNDGTTCSWCHNPNRASSGWSADSTSFVHAIHSSAKRSSPFTWHAIGTAAPFESFAEIEYPGILGQCETCHVPGSYELGDTTNKLYRTVATGSIAVPAAGSNAEFSLSKYIDLPATSAAVGGFGSGFSFNAGTGVTTVADPKTLVISPTATACFACHDSTLAQQHMETNGGSIYKARSVALAKGEQCALCHGPGKVADVKLMHAR